MRTCSLLAFNLVDKSHIYEPHNPIYLERAELTVKAWNDWVKMQREAEGADGCDRLVHVTQNPVCGFVNQEIRGDFQKKKKLLGICYTRSIDRHVEKSLRAWRKTTRTRGDWFNFCACGLWWTLGRRKNAYKTHSEAENTALTPQGDTGARTPTTRNAIITLRFDQREEKVPVPRFETY